MISGGMPVPVGALIGALGSSLAGGAAGLGAAKAAKTKAQMDKELSTVHTTEPGFKDFGADLVDDEANKRSLSLIGPKVDFTLAKKNPYRFGQY